MPEHSSASPATASVSAGIAAANAHAPKPEPGPRFPAEDGGRSLAEMAQADLDAALQLLAERAQYITAASGAAIALRRGEHNDMLCRASTGSNAPELGSLLSMEYGLSGECVRTRQPLRCDDAERDPRVNHEVCRQLGIASVVVMPIVSDDQTLGVFELFSGKPRAFDERDLSALQRLSEMVETAVKHAAAAQTPPPTPEPMDAPTETSADAVAEMVEAPVDVIVSDPVPTPPAGDFPRQEIAKLELETKRAETKQEEKDRGPALRPSFGRSGGPPPVTIPAPPSKKAPYWSAATHMESASAGTKEQTESVTVPPILRHLQKCQACGFPVSQGRSFCVECEEKQWRGERPPKPQAAEDQQPPLDPQITRAEAIPAEIPAQTDSPSVQTSQQRTEAATAQLPISTPTPSSGAVEATQEVAQPLSENIPEGLPDPENSTLFSSSVQSESWLASNKYILAALLVVAIVIAAVAWLR